MEKTLLQKLGNRMEANYAKTIIHFTTQKYSRIPHARAVGGLHPSKYENSAWVPDIVFAEFSPTTESKFMRKIKAYKGFLSGMGSHEKENFEIFNGGLESISSKNYEEALKNFTKAIQATSEKSVSSSHYSYIGTTLWCMGYQEAAITVWNDGLEASYSDYLGGIKLPCLLLYAATILNEKSLEEKSISLLRERWESTSQRNSFLGILVGYILGEIKAEQLLDSVDYFHRNIKERQLCQIEFYLGLNHLRQGENIKPVEHLRNCIFAILTETSRTER